MKPNSYHPSRDLLPGEETLNVIYDAILDSPNPEEILLIVTFDEHGGQYDHVSPTFAARPFDEQNPDSAGDPVESHGFKFDLLGVRVPTVLVSPFIESKTVFRSTTEVPFDSTSFLATLLSWYDIPRDSWGLGKRVADAPTFENVLTRSTKRTDSPRFTPSFEDRRSLADVEVSDLHARSAERITFYLGADKYSEDELCEHVDNMLQNAKNLAELHKQMKELID